MNRYFLTLITVFFLFCLSGALAQNPLKGPSADKPLRLEIPVSSDAETYRIVPFGNKGMILFFRSNEVVNDTMFNWYFAQYDQNLRQTWIKSVPVPVNLEFLSDEKVSDTLVILFKLKEKEKKAYYTHLILRVSANQGKFIGNYTKLPNDVELSAFRVLGQHAFFGIDQKNTPSAIHVLDLQTGVAFQRTLVTSTPSSVQSFSIDTLNNRLLVFLKKQFNRNDYENYLVILDADARIISEVLISPITANRFIRDLRFFPAGGDDLVACGSYGFGDGQKSSNSNNVTGDVAGIFFSMIRKGEQQNISLTNFLELKNAGNLLGERDLLTLRKKKEKNNAAYTQFSLNLNVLVHPIIRQDGQYIVFFESYTPEYQTESSTEFDFYGRPYTVSVPVFQGYRFLNGIVASYDEEGKLKWDNTIDVRNLLTYNLSSRLNISFSGPNAILSYSSEGKIASKIIQGNAVVEPLDFTPVELLRPEDKLVSESKSIMLPWYGNYFLNYGYEEIKNISLPENNKRLVFYCTKIRYE